MSMKEYWIYYLPIFEHKKNRSLMQTRNFTVCTKFLLYIIGGEFMKKSFVINRGWGFPPVDGYNIS